MPDPTVGNVIFPLLILKLPAPPETLTTLVPLSYTPCAYTVLAIAVLPETVSPVSVPTLVIALCAALVTVNAVVAAPLNVPEIVPVVILPMIALPDTVNEPNVPTWVILV